MTLYIGVESDEPITRIRLSNLEGLNFKGISEIRFPADPVVSNVPTLSEWGLIAMAAILGIVGFMVMRRRELTA